MPSTLVPGDGFSVVEGKAYIALSQVREGIPTVYVHTRREGSDGSEMPSYI
jgi:hypothetical protein